MHKEVALSVPDGQEDIVIEVIFDLLNDNKTDDRSKLIAILDLLSSAEDYSEGAEEEDPPPYVDRLWAASKTPMDSDPVFGGSGASIRHEVAEARLGRRNSIKKLSSASAKSSKIRTRARKNLFSTLLNSIKSQ